MNDRPMFTTIRVPVVRTSFINKSNSDKLEHLNGSFRYYGALKPNHSVP